MNDEVLRRQFADIVISDDLALRLEYRNHILGKLMPKRIEKIIEGGQEFKITIKEPESRTGKEEKEERESRRSDGEVRPSCC